MVAVTKSLKESGGLVGRPERLGVWALSDPGSSGLIEGVLVVTNSFREAGGLVRRPEHLGVWAFPVSGSCGFIDGGSVAGGRSHCCSVSGE